MRWRIHSPEFWKRRTDVGCIFGIALLAILFDISPHAPLRIAEHLVRDFLLCVFEKGGALLLKSAIKTVQVELLDGTASVADKQKQLTVKFVDGEKKVLLGGDTPIPEELTLQNARQCLTVSIVAIVYHFFSQRHRRLSQAASPRQQSLSNYYQRIQEHLKREFGTSLRKHLSSVIRIIRISQVERASLMLISVRK